MNQELEKIYDPQGLEERIYHNWEEKGYFHAEPDPGKKPFTIVMPPPNVTGQLHIGHAWDNTMQDILIRFKRMQGYNALWQPGTDHAAIATELKLVEALQAEGLKKEDLGREGFLKRAWAWKEEYGGRIVGQLKKMGSSADWERERFTMDEGGVKAVEEAFLCLNEKGYIYRGDRIVSWCPDCQTTVSDAEVEHEEQEGSFWHINYSVIGKPGIFIEIATTRPETMLGDTAVAVHPEDERYQDLIGEKALLPLMGREIPIVADPYVDPEFGTGAVKITPAHDPNDFELGKRHDLPVINVLNDDATINGNGGKYEGLERYEARKAILEDLKELGLFVKTEKHMHNVGVHDRCGTVIEPMAKAQWFLAMEELAKPAIAAIENGELKFVPERFDKIYLHWLNNIRDWNISRQLWWGHRIPAWYCDKCKAVFVGRQAPETCSVCGERHFTQEEDTLDTWFSSALWPFSTLGWPEETKDLNYFYPTDVLVTAYDIIFFWVVRMVFSGYEHMGKAPFHTVLIHGLIRDELGRKMSKSLGNGVDPLEIIDQYGADTLRLTLIIGNAPGNDMRFQQSKLEASRNFANKIWNAARFILMHEASQGSQELGAMEAEDKWILSKVNTLAREVTANLDKFELGIAVQKVYDFIWDEFCDWYIEFAKVRLYKKEEEPALANRALLTLRTVLAEAMKLLHPFMPFITEEIFLALQPEEETIMLSSWPEYQDAWAAPEEEEAIEMVKALVRAVRNLRAEMEVPPSRKVKMALVCETLENAEIYENLRSIYAGMAGAEEITVLDTPGDVADTVSVVTPYATVYIPLAELIDFEKERARLEKEKDRLTKELARSHQMLNNEKFLSKAPAEKIEEEKEKLKTYQQMMEQVEERRKALQK